MPFFVPSLIIKIGLVIVFTAVFSLAMASFTNADKAARLRRRKSPFHLPEYLGYERLNVSQIRCRRSRVHWKHEQRSDVKKS